MIALSRIDSFLKSDELDLSFINERSGADRGEDWVIRFVNVDFFWRQKKSADELKPVAVMPPKDSKKKTQSVTAGAKDPLAEPLLESLEYGLDNNEQKTHDGAKQDIIRENRKKSSPREIDNMQTDSKGMASRELGHETTDEVQYPLNGNKGEFKYRDTDGSMNHPAFRVQDIDINIKKGSLVMIIGKIGSGKSS